MNGSNNILYPKDDKDRRVLLFACRNCEHQVTHAKLSVQSPPNPRVFGVRSSWLL
jgi:DNA-directed RNA polymerase subunit M/transcription elongation factor TFIIS